MDCAEVEGMRIRIDLTPLADAAAQIAFIALIGFIVWVCLR